MAIEIEAPDGSIVEFPDGTDDATIERAMQQTFTQSRPRQFAPSNAPRSAYDEISGVASRVRNFLPGTDELQGALKGAGEAVRGFMDPSSGGVSVLDTADGVSMQERLQGAQGGYQQGYQREVTRERDQRDDFAARKPVISGAIDLGGALATGGLIAAPAAAAVGARGGNLLMRAGAASTAGAAYGATYGFADRGNVEQRGQNALIGGGVGAVTGAAFPVAGRAIGTRAGIARTPLAVAGGSSAGAAAGGAFGYASGTTDEERAQLAGEFAGVGAALGGGAALAAPAVRQIGRTAGPAFNRLMSDTSGMAPAGAMGWPPGQPPRRRTGGAPTVRDEVDTSLQRMAARRQLTPDKLEEIAQEAEATGRNPLAAQVLGEPGLQRLQTNASLPGQAAQRTADTIAARRSGAAQRVTDDIDTAMGSQTRMGAKAGIATDFEAMAAEYNPLLSQTRLSPQATSRIDDALSFIPEREIDTVTAAAGRIAKYDGLSLDTLPPAQRYHYLKMGIGQRIDGMGREGLEGVERQRLTQALGRFRGRLEDAVPGYKELNGRWMDTAQSEEALKWADDFFAGGKNAMRPEEIAAEFKAMSEAQQQAALVSIRTRMLQSVEDRSKTGVRKTNITDPFLSETFDRRMQAVLGDDAAPLLRKIRAEDRDFNELGSAIPRANSKTAAVFADMADQMAQGAPSRGNILAGVTDYVWRKATNPLLEGRRNKETEALLKELTPAQIRALGKTIRDRMTRRRKLTKDAVNNAALGAAFTDE